MTLFSFLTTSLSLALLLLLLTYTAVYDWLLLTSSCWSMLGSVLTNYLPFAAFLVPDIFIIIIDLINAIIIQNTNYNITEVQFIIL